MRLAALERRRRTTTRPPCARRSWPTSVAAPAGRASSRRRRRRSPEARRPPAPPAIRSSRRGGPRSRARPSSRRAPPSSSGGGGFAERHRPPGALVALPTTTSGASVGRTSAEARRGPAKVQGRTARSPCATRSSCQRASGRSRLQTTWVEPAYLEPDASWCVPGGVPASPLANGGAFGGKRRSPVADEARRLADEHGRAVLVLWTREEVVRRGPSGRRSPWAAGRRDRRHAGGPARRARPTWRRCGAAVAAVAPGLAVEEVAVAGPAGRPRAARRRLGRGRRAACVALAALRGPRRGRGHPVEVAGRDRRAGPGRASIEGDRVEVEVWAGEVLDEIDPALLLPRRRAPGARPGLAARASRSTSRAGAGSHRSAPSASCPRATCPRCT